MNNCVSDDSLASSLSPNPATLSLGLPANPQSREVLRSLPTIDGAVLASDLRANLKAHCHLPAHADIAVVLWLLHTYALNLRNYSPVLALTSEGPNSGKSTVIHWLSHLVALRRLLFNPTANAIFDAREEPFPGLADRPRFRETDPNKPLEFPPDFILTPPPDDGVTKPYEARPWRPTLLLDSLNQISAKTSDILCSGHCQQGSQLRVSRRHHTTVPISTWCPKALARVGSLPEAIISRSIQIQMEPKPPGVCLQRVRHEQGRIERKFVCQMVDWVELNQEAIAEAEPEFPPGIDNRLADNWEPLLAIADILGAQWPALAREALIHLSKTTEDASTPDPRILSKIREYFNQTGQTEAFTYELIDWLNRKPRRSADRMNPHRLAHYLRAFQIPVNHTIRRGEEVAKGYKLESFQPAFARHLIIKENSAAVTFPLCPPRSETPLATSHSSLATSEPLTTDTPIVTFLPPSRSATPPSSAIASCEGGSHSSLATPGPLTAGLPVVTFPASPSHNVAAPLSSAKAAVEAGIPVQTPGPAPKPPLSTDNGPLTTDISKLATTHQPLSTVPRKLRPAKPPIELLGRRFRQVD